MERIKYFSMIDPVTRWFKIAEIPSKRADDVVNVLETNWLTCYPWPTEIIIDCSKEFAAEVQETTHYEYGIHRKLITTHNPQANAMAEQVHQTVHNMVRSFKLSGKQDLDDTFDWLGILSAAQQAVIGTVHTINKAILSQLIFGQDAILNIQF